MRARCPDPGTRTTAPTPCRASRRTRCWSTPPSRVPPSVSSRSSCTTAPPAPPSASSRTAAPRPGPGGTARDGSATRGPRARPSASGTPLAEPPAAAASYAYASPAGAGVTVDAYAASYQTEETPEEARRRAERERAEAEYWARVEAEDDAREERAGEEEEEREKEARDRRRDARKDAKRKSKAAERAAAAAAAAERSSSGERASSASATSRSPAPKSSSSSSARAKKWVRFDERWAALEASASQPRAPLLGYDDIPWPPKMSSLLAHAVAGESGANDAARADASSVGPRETKLAYHRCVRRWHPDKFEARWGARLREEDRARVLERVNAVARALNVAFAARS